MAQSPRRIGLTGGIACGKSTVAAQFQRLGVSVIDADDIARQVVEPGENAWHKIRARFGSEFFLADERIDRAKLRRYIFTVPSARLDLEAIVHPDIRAAMETQAHQASGKYCILCVPLLIEAHLTDMVERILVVECSPQQQRLRLAQRDNLTTEEIDRILKAQCTHGQRLRYADDVLNNTAAAEVVQNAVTQLHERYLIWAGQGRRTKA
jgi:dephospho-CoA kinase